MKRFFVGVTVLGACVYAYACDNSSESHVYVASLYSATTACFAASTSLGYIDTPDGNLDCAPTCLATTTTAGVSEIYISTMCGPYPVGYDSSQTNAACGGAIQAWASASGPGTCVTSEDAGEDAAGEDGATDGTGESDGGGSEDAATDGASDANEDGGGTDAPPG